MSNVSSRPCFQLGPQEMGVLIRRLTSSCCIHQDGRGGALGPAPMAWVSSAQQGGDSSALLDVLSACPTPPGPTYRLFCLHLPLLGGLRGSRGSPCGLMPRLTAFRAKTH